MVADGESVTRHFILILPLFGAAVSWYFAAHAGVAGLTRHQPAPLLRAIANGFPVLVLAIAAVVLDRPAIAVGVLFSSSVAALSLVLGVVTCTAPPDTIGIDARRKWVFLLPACVLVFLAGYQSQFNLLHPLVLAAEGAVVLLLWMDDSGSATPTLESILGASGEEGREIAARPSSPKSGEPASDRSAPRIAGLVLVFVAIVLSCVGAWLALRGADRLLHETSIPTMSIIAALLMGPALAIPMIGPSCTLAQQGQFTQMTSSLVAFVLMNLCVTLPVLVVLWYTLHITGNTSAEWYTSLYNGPIDSPLVFPLVVWRVDTILLMLVALALLPMSMGRWTPGRLEGGLLILLYAAYMLLWRIASSLI